MMIPRENRLVRLYIQLNEVYAGAGPVDKSKITPTTIIKTAQKILSPFSLEYHYIDWLVSPVSSKASFPNGCSSLPVGGLHTRSVSALAIASVNSTASFSQEVSTLRFSQTSQLIHA